MKDYQGFRHKPSCEVIVELHKIPDAHPIMKDMEGNAITMPAGEAGQYYTILKGLNGRELYRSSRTYKDVKFALNATRKVLGFGWKGDYRDYTRGDGRWLILYHY